MKRLFSVASALTFSVLYLFLAIQAQAGCKDLAGADKLTYSKPTMIFTVDYPDSMSWVMELGESKVKFRTRPPGMIGFQFGHTSKPESVDQFNRSVSDWSPAFEFDYGDAEVTVYAGPNNQPRAAEYRALLPNNGDLYSMYAMLEWGEMGCDEDRRTDLEAAIKSLKPNPDFSP